MADCIICKLYIDPDKNTTTDQKHDACVLEWQVRSDNGMRVCCGIRFNDADLRELDEGATFHKNCTEYEHYPSPE